MKQHPIKLDVKKKPQSIKDSCARWIILFLACIVLMGDAFSFDNPQSLETQLETHFKINQVEFNLFYSVYSIPNIILPLFGGYLIDNCGVRVNLLLFSIMLVLGQFLFTISVEMQKYWLAVVGRLVFGVGSECLTISQTSLVSYWFNYDQLSLAVGLSLSVPRLGGALNSFLVPHLYDETKSLTMPLAYSTAICFIFSFVYEFIKCYKQVGSIALICLDRAKRNQQTQEPSSPIAQQNQSSNNVLKYNQTTQRQISQRTSRTQRPFENIFELYPKYGLKPIEDQDSQQAEILPQNINDKEKEKTVASNQDTKIQSLGKQQQRNSSSIEISSPKAEVEEKVLFSQIKKLPRIFWILMIVCSLAESLFVPFLNNANKLYQHRFGFSTVSAGEVLVVPYLAACFFTPFVGLYIGPKRDRGRYILKSSLVFLITHSWFAMQPSCNNECLVSIVPLVLLGFCFAGFASVIMPSVPLFINDEQLLGTAFGMVAIFQNFLLSLFPLFSASVFEGVAQNQSSEEKGFMYVSALFVGTSALMVGMSILLYLKSKKLKLPNNIRKSLERKQTGASISADEEKNKMNE